MVLHLDIMVMMPENSKKGIFIHMMNGKASYHLCPRCFPYIDLYCEVCEGHGEYLMIDSEKNT
jgi:hypothetical protein